MVQYRFEYTMKGPSEETEGMYLAEIPVLPGCRAWGEIESEAYENLVSVATEFMRSYYSHGDKLPAGVEPHNAESTDNAMRVVVAV